MEKQLTVGQCTVLSFHEGGMPRQYPGSKLVKILALVRVKNYTYISIVLIMRLTSQYRLVERAGFGVRDSVELFSGALPVVERRSGREAILLVQRRVSLYPVHEVEVAHLVFVRRSGKEK